MTVAQGLMMLILFTYALPLSVKTFPLLHFLPASLQLIQLRD